MRHVKDIPDIQKVLNELLDWKDLHATKDWDFHRLRIKNASPSVDDNDYVVRSELMQVKEVNTVQSQNYAIVFSSIGIISVGTNLSAPYSVCRHRVGEPSEVQIAAIVAPTGASILANIAINGTPILVDDIELPSGQTTTVSLARFINPLPRLSYKSLVTPIITQVGSILPGSLVSITLEVKRIL